MKTPVTTWDGTNYDTMSMETALGLEADGLVQIITVDVGAHQLWTPEEFMKHRAMLAKKKPAKDDETKKLAPSKSGEYRTVDMKAKK